MTKKTETKKLEKVALDDLEQATGGCAACGAQSAGGGQSQMMMALLSSLGNRNRR